VLKIGPYDQKTMIVEVSDDHVAFMIESNATGRVKLLPVDPLEAELAKELALAAEQLDAVIAGVRN